MGSKELSETELSVLYRAAEEFQTKGVITQTCPRCSGKLQYIGNRTSYRIFCENESICGIWDSVRGI